MKKIRDLSGGNLREMLRISHHAFERTQGELTNVDESLLEQCAEQSGTIADRKQLALSVTDNAMAELGTYAEATISSSGTRIDRLFHGRDGSPLAAVQIVTASDRVSEVDSARLVGGARAHLQKELPETQLIVVSVGYSSEEIRLILKEILDESTSFMIFDESRFAAELRSELTRIAASATSLRDSQTAGGQEGSSSAGDDRLAFGCG